jgi:hypothetical protein
MSVSGDDLDWEFALCPRPGIRPALSEEQMAKKSKRRCDTLPILRDPIPTRHHRPVSVCVGSEALSRAEDDRDKKP